MNCEELIWTREPSDYSIQPDRIEIITEPHTDLWQRTYYHFRNDNAPVLQMETEEKYFSFVVKTDFKPPQPLGFSIKNPPKWTENQIWQPQPDSNRCSRLERAVS